jgi:hypothetical protein
VGIEVFLGANWGVPLLLLFFYFVGGELGVFPIGSSPVERKI